MAKLMFSPINNDSIVSGPSAWDQFLLGAGLNESSCSSLLTGRSRKARAIRSWVREHYATRYVPEDVLEALGLRRQLRSRWQGDEQ